MVNTYDINLTDRAGRVGLTLTVSVSSRDAEAHQYLFTRGDGMTKDFPDIVSASTWLDGYVEGVATATCAERSRSIRQDLGC